MRHRNNRAPAFRRAAQRGYSLIELSVAMLVALFLLAGLLTVLQGTRKTSLSQSSLAQLQDDERIAMTILANVVQEAGYFPDPTQNTSTSLAGETDSGLGVGGSRLADGRRYDPAALRERFQGGLSLVRAALCGEPTRRLG